MDLITTLEKRFGGWAIPNLTLYLLATQLIGFALLAGGYSDPEDLVLVGGLVRVGDWTRLFSFMMIPSTMRPIFLFFACYIFYLMGTALEREWGTFRFNLYILIGYLLTLAAAFIAPEAIIWNSYFLGSVFLAFATLFPNFQLNLFFILPVKVKWLGWLTVGFYLMTLFSSNTGNRLCVTAAFANYLLFFGKDIVNNIKAGQRRKNFVAEQAVTAAQAMHVCTECGVTDKSDPLLNFRYCSVCARCYCENHISNHTHAGQE
jgi:hypothetical protein